MDAINSLLQSGAANRNAQVNAMMSDSSDNERNSEDEFEHMDANGNVYTQYTPEEKEEEE